MIFPLTLFPLSTNTPPLSKASWKWRGASLEGMAQVENSVEILGLVDAASVLKTHSPFFKKQAVNLVPHNSCDELSFHYDDFDCLGHVYGAVPGKQTLPRSEATVLWHALKYWRLGVVPTGKSISVSVAVALHACVRAKLCAGV